MIDNERERPAQKESVVFLLYKDSQVLLEKRTDRTNDPYSGMLIVPGGKVEQEDYSQPNPFLAALLREVAEELSVKPLKIVHLFDNPRNITPKGNVYYSRVYLITEWQGAINLCKQPAKATAVWMDINEAERAMPLEFSKEIIAAVKVSLSHPAQ